MKATKVEIQTGDDWVKLIINGKTEAENHSLEADTVVEALQKYIPDITLTSKFGEWNDDGEFEE